MRFLPFIVLLAVACGGKASAPTNATPTTPTDAGAGDAALSSNPDAGAVVVVDAGSAVAYCEACAALHCQTYGQCERDPLCLQALADYVTCNGQGLGAQCALALENNAHVPGDITLCVTGFCTVDCQGN